MTDTDVSLSAPTNSAADTEIDLYADVGENELVNEASDDYLTGTTHLAQDADLYNDVITTPSSSTDFTDITNTVHGTNNRAEPNGSSMNNNNSSSSYGGKRFSLYVGQLTWWTTDADLTEAIHELGIQDLLELKFHENRANGQSKGFAVVTVGSDASSRALLDKLPKREIYGQKPMVLHCNKQSLSFFESATRKDEPAPPMSNPPIRPMMHPSMGLPLPMPRPGGPMDGTYRFHHQGHVLLPGGQPGLARPPMGMAVPGRAPVPGGPMVLGQMSGPGGQGPVVVMQPGGPRPGVNGAHLIRQPVRPGAPAPMQMMPGQHPPAGYYPGQPVPPGAPGHLMPGQTHPDAYYRPGDLRHDNATLPPISEVEFNEIMTQNKNVSTSAITRAVEDASRGEFGTAIETLVTAISLIKQSKIAHDDRCKILISSLQDTLKGIEDKSYGSRARHRSRSGSRESSRKKHRHRSRSPRDRNEYRRSEDYDSKYSREHRRR